jgi:leucyl aminopeptidase
VLLSKTGLLKLPTRALSKEGNVRVSALSGKATAIKTEALVLGIFEEEKKLPGTTAAFDKSSGGVISDMLRTGEFMGKEGQVVSFPAAGRVAAVRVVLTGLGKREEYNADKARQAIGKASTFCRERNLGDIVVWVDVLLGASVALEELAGSAVEGAMLGLYKFSKYKTEKEEEQKEVSRLRILTEESTRLSDIRKAVSYAELTSQAANWARDLINAPSNEITPSTLADHARKLSRRRGLKCRVLGPQELRKLSMNGILGVGKGSSNTPRFIILEHVPTGSRGGPVVLVGKGITFDSGGISIKPSQNLEQMKDDMAGAAAVLCTLDVVSQLRLPLHVVGLIPAAENLPSGTAYKPGDILRMASGKTVEIISTDAEGRLLLADALHYASRYKPVAVIDVATLTGACVIALGEHASGLLGNDQALIDRIKQAAEVTWERVWQLPLWEDYAEPLKSEVADTTNTGGRPAQTIVATKFLEKFIGEYPWAHLDIAGTSWIEKERPYNPKGATGVGVRLLSRLLTDWEK